MKKKKEIEERIKGIESERTAFNYGSHIHRLKEQLEYLEISDGYLAYKTGVKLEELEKYLDRIVDGMISKLESLNWVLDNEE